MTPEVGVEFGIYDHNGNLFVKKTTDKEGKIYVTLPYGHYTLKQLTSTKDHEFMDDYKFEVKELGETNKVFANAPIEARLKVIKIDSETGKIIARAHIKFKIFNVDTGKYVSQTITYPTATTIDVFETDSNGILITPYPLESGTYRLEEVDQMIDGYLWNSEGLEFTISNNTDLINDEVFGAILEIKFANQEVKGTIEINKIGEDLVIKDDSYIYEEIALPNVEFGLYDENGNLIDSNNQIFKSKDEIEDWVKSLEIDSNDNKGEVISIADIQKAVGITITDDEDKEIEFENTPQGIADYINSVVETTRETVAQQTLETLYAQYPFLESILTYYVANGNSIKGFNELRDRSNIRLDANNEAQLEAIIRDAWRETNRKGNVDDYINYLKSSNKLYDIASEELDDMVERDKAAKESLAQKAIEVEKQREEESRQYWGKVKETIDNRVIGKYKLPETILVNRNGKKVAVTPNDFYNYLYRVDQNGHSQYENELAQETPENNLNDALLRAYLKFTGGSYESLVNMAINEEKINAIRLKSRKTATTKIKVTTPKSKSNDIDLGYN